MHQNWVIVFLLICSSVVDCSAGSKNTRIDLGNSQDFTTSTMDGKSVSQGIKTDFPKNAAQSEFIAIHQNPTTPGARRRRRRRRRTSSLTSTRRRRTSSKEFGLMREVQRRLLYKTTHLQNQVGELMKDNQEDQIRIADLEARVGKLEGSKPNVAGNASQDDEGEKAIANITKSLFLVSTAVNALDPQITRGKSDCSGNNEVKGLFQAFHLVWTSIPADLHRIVNNSPRLSELARRGGLAFPVIEQDKLRHPIMQHIQEAAANWGYDVKGGIAKGHAHRVGPPRPKLALIAAFRQLAKASKLLGNLREIALKLSKYNPPPWADELACAKSITGAKCEYHAERACPPEWLGPCVRTPKAGKLRHGTCASSSLSMANGLRCDSS